MLKSHEVVVHNEHDNRILRVAEVVAITGLSASTLWRLQGMGKFPARRQLSPGAVGWFAGDVARWLSERQAVTAENVKPVATDSRRGRKPKYPSEKSSSVSIPTISRRRTTN